jgi:two-component system chemotaxis response regulator CheB
MNGKEIRVLVVDDSLLFREVMAQGLSTDPEISVVAKASDPYDARNKLLIYKPDVMTCDVEMPKMNGIEFIRQLLPQYPIPVVVASAVSESVFEALDAGAVDFVAKPTANSPAQVKGFILDMIAKIKIAARSSVRSGKPEQTVSQSPAQISSSKLIAIGASTGGTEAIFNILRKLPSTTPGILIVQHIPPVFSRLFAERLDKLTLLKVKEAQNGEYIEQGKVLISPGDNHMKIKKIGDRYKVEVFPGDKVHGHCPSVDILFDSVAKEAGKNALGIILTGMGYDGAKGLLAMRRKGARTIGQDENSSVVYGMPKVAYEIGAVEKQAALNNIPSVLYAMLRQQV